VSASFTLIWTGLDVLGQAAFALSGALAGARRRLDVFGLSVLAMVTAVGGGTLRDLLLGRPVAWVMRPELTLAVVGFAVVGVVLDFRRHVNRFQGYLAVTDALGLGLAAVLGTQLARDSGVAGISAVIIGSLSGFAGGMIRDVLVNEVPLVLRREVYATAALAGATLFWCLPASTSNTLVAIQTVVLLRLVAVRWRLNLPYARPPKTQVRDDARSV
jgi:uncharacterized membrane protein YeiH